MVKVADIPNKGRGLCTDFFIKEGAIVEVSPAIITEKCDEEHISNTVLDNYWYVWDADKGQSAFALGCGSLFNHSYDPNCKYTRNFESKEIIFTAIRDIQPGDELTINYMQGYPNEKVWFDAVE